LSRIDTGEGQPRLDLRSGADVARIAEFFATVGRSLAGQRTGVDGEDRRMAGIGRMVSAVAHQIRNPLNAMVLTIATMRERVDGEARRHLDVLDREVRRLDEVIQGFVRLARPERLPLEPLRLEPLLAEVLERSMPRARAGGTRVESSVGDHLPTVAGNPDLLKEALTNLIANALEAVGGGGSVRVDARRDAAGGIAVTIRDSGCGIPASVLPRVFDLYFTTKEEGSGIGLPLVKRIAELHGGDVRVDSLEGRGTTVTLTLPEARA
jgi:signal transduction histidine kinase